MTEHTIIDVETHVKELPDLWTKHLPAAMCDAVPLADADARGRHSWYLGREPKAASLADRGYRFEQTAPRRSRDKVGVDNIPFETDSPHPASLSGQEVRVRIAGGPADCDARARRQILWSNARKRCRVDVPSAAA